MEGVASGRQSSRGTGGLHPALRPWEAARGRSQVLRTQPWGRRRGTVAPLGRAHLPSRPASALPPRIPVEAEVRIHIPTAFLLDMPSLQPVQPPTGPRVRSWGNLPGAVNAELQPRGRRGRRVLHGSGGFPEAGPAWPGRGAAGRATPPWFRRRQSPWRPRSSTSSPGTPQRRLSLIRAWDPGLGYRPGRRWSPLWPLWTCSCPSGACRRTAPGGGSSRCPGTRPLCRTQRTGNERPCHPRDSQHPGARRAARSPDLRLLAAGERRSLPTSHPTPSLSPGPDQRWAEVGQSGLPGATQGPGLKVVGLPVRPPSRAMT